MDELDAIETKSYEYSAYIKAQQKHQVLNESSPSYALKNKNSMDSYFGELFFNYKYFLDKYTFNLDFSVNHENIDKVEQNSFTSNQAFVTYKYNENHQLTVGKKTPKWGKGYFFNPAAFIDRKKDPNDPEASREGYAQLNYKYNKVFQNDLQNLSVDLVYIKTTKGLNEDIYDDSSNILALKTYMLYKDIDIDIIYAYSDEQENRLGVDFSTNLETNFEIHGEYGRADDGYYSYLLGLKYLTESELTILSEYFYQSETQARNSSFWDNRYFMNSFNQKEPFGLLYFNVYFKNMLNLDDDSYQNKIGVVYSGIKNLEIDLSFSKNSGKSSSEFGGKLVDKFSWLVLKYSF
jgi:hypothetical protein